MSNRFRTWLAVAADSPSELRSVDVDRVLRLAGKEWAEMKEWLLAQDLQMRTRLAVCDWEPEE